MKIRTKTNLKLWKVTIETNDGVTKIIFVPAESILAARDMVKRSQECTDRDILAIVPA